MNAQARLLAVSMAVALVVGVGGGIVLSRVLTGDDVDVSLDEPGVYPMLPPEQLSIIGDRFPDVEVLDVDGNQVATGTLVGQPLVVNLWYSSCAPCTRQLPDLAEVSDEYVGRVRFVGINPVDDVDTMLDLATDLDVNYELYRDEHGWFVEAMGVAFPMTIFVAADGTVVEQTGELDADGLRSRLEAML